MVIRARASHQPSNRPKPSHGCVVVGSFHTSADLIGQIAQQFRDAGIEVLWPKQHLRFIDSKEDFPRDVMDPPNASAKKLEQRVLELGIDSPKCCWVYLVNPYRKGVYHFGNDTSFELGWAAAKGKPIYTYESVANAPVILHRTAGVKTPEELIRDIATGRCPCGRRSRRARKQVAAVGT